MRTPLTLLSTAVILAFGAAEAAAAPINFVTDDAAFGNVFSGASGSASVMFLAPDGITITIAAITSSTFLTWEADGGFGVGPDGGGVGGYELDESEAPEVLAIGFSAPVSNLSLGLASFFFESPNASELTCPSASGETCYFEQGLYSVNFGPPTGFAQTDMTQQKATSDGLFTLPIGGIVNTIFLTGLGGVPPSQIGQGHEFSLLSVNYTPDACVPGVDPDCGQVPEPAGMTLFGLSLAAAGWFARRRRAPK